jgi:hypothetical protein
LVSSEPTAAAREELLDGFVMSPAPLAQDDGSYVIEFRTA